MGYIGNQPAERYSTMDKQTITGDGTVGPYTLDHFVGNEQEIEVFVNNVRQEPSVAYTVSADQLTMTGTVSSSDDFYVVFQGKATLTATHPSTFDLNAANGTFTGDLTVDTNTLHVDSTNNRVGVGTTSTDITGTSLDNFVVGDGSTNAGVVVNAGSSDSSSYAFALNTTLDGRFLYSSANGLQVETGGTQRMRIARSTGDISFYADNGTTQGLFWDASTERLGLGTTSPENALDVKSTGTAYGTGYIVSRHMNSSGTKGVFLGYDADETAGTIGGANALTFQTYSGGWDERMRLDSSGRVGINQTSMTGNFALHVTGLGGGSNDARALILKGAGNHTAIGSTGPTLALQNTNSTVNNIVKLSFESASAGETVSINAINTNHSSHYGDMAFNTRGSDGYSEKMRIMANGNVGIGTSSPASNNKLDVVANGVDKRIAMRTQNTSGYASVEAQVNNYWSGATYTGTALVQYDSAVTGTTVGLSNANLGALRFQNVSNGLIYTNGSTPIVFGTLSTERMRIDSSGNVGIGTTSPGEKLDVNGDARIRDSVIVGASSSKNKSYASNFSTNAADIQITLERTNTAAGWGGIGANSAASFMVYNSSTQKVLNIDDGDGSISFPTGTGGVYLGGTGSANKLDDYEEGTWTPSLGGTHTMTAGTYGRYTKVGNIVSIQFKIHVNTIGTGSDHQIQGLPFTSNNIGQVQSGVISFSDSAKTSNYWLGWYVENNATTGQIVGKNQSSANVYNGIPTFQNGTIVFGSAVYRTA